MKILAIVGSPRLKGNTNYLVDVALREAKNLGAKTEKVILSQYEVNPCQGHDNCGSLDVCVQKDDTGWILEKFCEADVVIPPSPVAMTILRLRRSPSQPPGNWERPEVTLSAERRKPDCR
jgi:multimeric flavodoxin WrbA